MSNNRADRVGTQCLPGPQEKFGVIGRGAMGRALVHGILRSSLPGADQLWGAARRPDVNEALAKALGIPVVTDYTQQLANTAMILFCVKPMQAGAVIARLKQSALRANTLLVSIAAGISVGTLEELTGTANPWIRAMPNTPSVAGESMTVICAGRNAAAEHAAKAQKPFSAVGRCRAMEEHRFNAIAALSGSGSAYICLIVEALADAGVKARLPRALAAELVAQTVIGPARRVQTTGRPPAALRNSVTTPAGCTIGGLSTLEDGKIGPVLARAVEEAARIAQNPGKTQKAKS
jgi:pyrroline-5-carboxylate reductase